MKKLLICLFIFSTFTVSAFAADAVASPGLPEWINGVFAFLASIPKVGPVLSSALLWIGAIASFFTALTVFARAILVIPMVAAHVSKSQEWVSKIDSLSTKVSYWLDQFSILNAKKK